MRWRPRSSLQAVGDLNVMAEFLGRRCSLLTLTCFQTVFLTTEQQRVENKTHCAASGPSGTFQPWFSRLSDVSSSTDFTNKTRRASLTLDRDGSQREKTHDGVFKIKINTILILTAGSVHPNELSWNQTGPGQLTRLLLVSVREIVT